MVMRLYFFYIFTLLALLPVYAENAAPAASQEAAPEIAPALTTGDKWKFEVAPYAFLSVINTKLTLGEIKTESTMGIGDVLKALKFGAFSHAEAHTDRFGFFNDLSYAKLGDATNVKLKRGYFRPGIDVDAELTQFIAELGAYYRFGGERVTFDLLGGARYIKFGVDVDLDFGPIGRDLERDLDWVDPFLGSRLGFQLGERWKASIRTDVGGFGAGSKFSFNTVAGVRYAINESVDLGFGYKYFYFDYENENLEMKTAAHGPLMGVVFKF